jgi:5-formyltetrahydrofolate cyclo-ligase
MTDNEARLKKAALRARFRRRRDEATVEDCLRASSCLCEHLAALDVLDETRVLAGYVSFRNEISIHAFLEARLRAGRAVCLPRVVGHHLEFVAVESFDDLVPGAFGIHEPKGDPFPTNEIGVFIVPGLVFDRVGNRLGFGKGYYDRVLDPGRDPRPLAIGVGYAWQLIDSPMPAEPHDVPMDVIVTENERVSTSGRVHI